MARLALAAAVLTVPFSSASTLAAAKGQPAGAFPLADVQIRYVQPTKKAPAISPRAQTIARNFIRTLAEAAAGSFLGDATLKSVDGATKSTSYYLSTQRGWLKLNGFTLKRVAATVVVAAPTYDVKHPNQAQQWTVEARIKFAFENRKGTYQVAMNYYPTKPGWIAIYAFWVTQRGFPRMLQSVVLAPAFTPSGGQPVSEATGPFSLKSYNTPKLPGPPPPPPFNKDGYVS